jgi:hypothetical protein
MSYARLEPVPYTFITDVLRIMIGLSVLICVYAALYNAVRLSGYLAGALIAIALYLTAMQGGRVFTRTRHFAATMIWLLLSQVVLWIGMAIAIIVCKVDTVGFAISFSVLPASILLTLFWYLRPLPKAHHD